MKKHKLVQQIDASLAAHASWHREMEIQIKRGRRDISPDDIAHPAGCFIGDWLESETLDAETRKSEPYSVVRWLHGECHKLMTEIVGLVRDGRDREAVELLDSNCSGIHNTLERALMAWREQVVGQRTVSFYAS